MSAKVNKKSNPSKTVLTIVIGFLLLFLVTKYNWSLSIAFLVGLAGVLSDYLAQKIEFLWIKLTLILSYIVPTILLSLIFFLILFPIASLSKLFGKKDPLQLKNTKKSLWKQYDRTFDKAYFENPW